MGLGGDNHAKRVQKLVEHINAQARTLEAQWRLSKKKGNWSSRSAASSSCSAEGASWCMIVQMLSANPHDKAARGIAEGTSASETMWLGRAGERG